MATVPMTSPSYYGQYGDRDQPTYNTVADYIADARTLLQDTVSPYRYDDPSLITALNAALLSIKRLRSDLFVFNLKTKGQVQSFTANDDTYVDIEPVFRPAVLYGICGHAMARDQEEYADSRSSAFLALAAQVLLGRAAVGPITGGAGPGGPGG